MSGKKRIRDIGNNKNINIRIDDAQEVFRALGIDPETQYLMDVKREIFIFYGLGAPVVTVKSPRKTLAKQKPENANGIKITDKEMRQFMKLFGLTEDDWFQESIGGRIVNDIKKSVSKTSSVKGAGKAKSDPVATISTPTEKDDESAYPEGKESYRTHRKIERDSDFPKIVKSLRLRAEGKLECDVCGFDFFRIYGPHGQGFIEAHHKVPVSKLRGKQKTKASDFALVCSNCHRMLHRGPRLLTVPGLRKMVCR